MTNQHPITPSPELVQQWYDEARDASLSTPKIEKMVATRAAQWGADTELEACCEWLNKYRSKILAADLRYVRRPKPPSLKQQALADFDWTVGRTLGRPEFDERSERIRRALEALPE